MKLTFLGTSAAEGVPSLYCDCETCEKTRILKGKNIRKRSSLLVNDDLIIDMGPDLYAACSKNNIALNKVEYALITHCHFDHFYPENIEVRYRRYQLKHFPTLNILANSSVFFKLTQMGYKDEELYVYCNFSNQEVGYDTSILNDEKILIKNYEKHQKGTLKPYESIVFYQKSRA